MAPNNLGSGAAVLHSVRQLLRADPRVYLGGDVDAATESLLIGMGRTTTREIPSESCVAITNVPSNVPQSSRWIHSPFMGVDSLLGNVDFAGRLLTRTSGEIGKRIASYVRAMDSAERWGLRGYAQSQTLSQWSPQPVLTHPGANALVLGTGKVGICVADALVGDGYRVEGLNTTGIETNDFAATWTMKTLPHKVDADLIVLALPLTKTTLHVVDFDFLRRFNRAHLVNVGRGATVQTESVVDALALGHLRHATLDVFEEEPLQPSSDLWRHDGVTITPHIAGPTYPADTARSFGASWESILAGGRPDGVVRQDRGY